MTRKESLHIGRVKGLPCACCGDAAPSDAHHIREGQGMAQRAGHFLTIPLCKNCHQGRNGIHGDRAMMMIYKTDELKMLDQTINKLYG